MIKHVLIGLLTFAATTAFTPLGSITPAYAVDNIEPDPTVDLTSVRSKIDAKDYAGALAELRDLAETDQQADVYNLLGFTLRKTGDFDTALTYYDKALQLEPDHKGAHEYLGELYVETGKMDKAQEQLASLTKLCPAGCEELDDLRNFIASK
ncbi:tetratricopeptide repeat protein [Phyllobacterium pellucidum]|uniref:tetratricopeptide repeat protein n=1 Tax=Phyllobacterium pellucidum TaxID=2740464 RepID=UPI001D157B2D|nr:tetratricopeptide repeat protein [Phyllobacterium sp. T1018]UGY08894.1 tetratricopeptide repeat protein [Phyllobacterium sp. T1018]